MVYVRVFLTLSSSNNATSRYTKDSALVSDLDCVEDVFFHNRVFLCVGIVWANAFYGILAEQVGMQVGIEKQLTLTLPRRMSSIVKLLIFAMSVVCGRPPEITVQSVPQPLLPVARLVTISNHLKYLQIRQGVQNSGKRPIAGPKFRTGGF